MAIVFASPSPTPMHRPMPPTWPARLRAVTAQILHSKLLWSVAGAALMLLLLWIWRPLLLIPGTQPLTMAGGDPHLRALMRTISASESNVMRPYHVLHGGDSVGTLERHPNRCEAIGQGPNRGNCSTAAGRYQLLFGTWIELAARYHPDRTADALDAVGLSFSALDQDRVVHAWLADPRAWRLDIAAQLRQGRVQPVLKRLSGTWTSLGHGIETNNMSRALPGLYPRLLKDELARSINTPAVGSQQPAAR